MGARGTAALAAALVVVPHTSITCDRFELDDGEGAVARAAGAALICDANLGRSTNRTALFPVTWRQDSWPAAGGTPGA